MLTDVEIRQAVAQGACSREDAMIELLLDVRALLTTVVAQTRRPGRPRKPGTGVQKASKYGTFGESVPAWTETRERGK